MFVCSRFGNLLAFAAYFCTFFVHWTSGQSNYCAISSCLKGQQTMCLYPRSTPSSQCVKYDRKGLLTNQEMNAIVNKHNQLRRKVANGEERAGNPGPQPRASNMKMLKWDAELAKVAQRYADQCISGHDRCRNVARYAVGQNIATSWSTVEIKRTVEDMVQSWYNEVKYFSRDNVAKYKFDASWGHYSQVVWAETSSIGCGRVLFWDSTRRMNCMRLICNYGPSGNYIGLPVYKIA